jgi:hypothetical protein
LQTNFTNEKPSGQIIIYIIKEHVQPKMSLNREFLIWKGRRRDERGRQRERERWTGGSAGWIFKVRFGRERFQKRNIKRVITFI